MVLVLVRRLTFGDEDIGPVALLVYNSSEFTLIIVPRSRRLLSEALNTTKSGILDRNCNEKS
jgi:hypothetical protein